MNFEHWRPRLVALDIDGTLVDHDGRLPAEVREAVRLVVDAGVPVVLATGRSWHGTVDVVEALDLPPGPTIASNGAVIVTHPPTVVQQELTFDPAPVIDRVAELAPEALIAVETVGRGYRLNGHFPADELSGEMHVQSLDELRASPVTRVIIRDPARTDEEFLALADQLGLHGVSYVVGYSAWLDIAPENVTKATALATVCTDLGVSRYDVLALGDGRNDIEMLTWAGRGVALGGSPAPVCAAADAVTTRFVDGGTAAELRRWFS